MPTITFIDGVSTFDAAGAAVPAVDVYRHVMTVVPRAPTKIVITNAVINGPLNFECTTVPASIEFQSCRFDSVINFEQASVKGLYFVDKCTLRGIAAAQLQVTFNLWLHDCVNEGTLTLIGAHIKGQLQLKATELRPSDENAMIADGMIVDQDLLCGDHFVAAGVVRLVGAHIGGQFCCEGGAEFRRPGDTALQLYDLQVDQDVNWAGGVTVYGGVNLTGAEIGGLINLTDAHIHHRAAEPALDLARAVVKQNMICQAGCTIEGRTMLAGASIEGNLWCAGGHFENANAIAIQARGLKVGRDVHFCRDDRGNGFVALGEVDLSDAAVGGSLDCTGGQFRNPDERALTAEGLNVTRDAILGAVFVAEGSVDLSDATVGGRLVVGFPAEPRAAIDLRWATVGQLEDNATWPEQVQLEGFVYKTLSSNGLTVRQRITWLRKRDYLPQIYLQLASVYQAMGSVREATMVGVAGEDARRKSRTDPLGRVKRVFGLLLKWSVGYGYRPLQVLWWLVGLEIIGTVVFRLLHQANALVPSGKPVPDFNAFLYTLDLLVPVVNLAQRSFWLPMGTLAVWLAAVFTAAGWILAACLLVGIGRIFKSGTSTQ